MSKQHSPISVRRLGSCNACNRSWTDNRWNAWSERATTCPHRGAASSKRVPGKTNCPSPLTECISRSIATPWRERGTMSQSSILGMARLPSFRLESFRSHSAASRLKDSHFAWRSSPGRTNTKGARRSAHCTARIPLYSSMPRRIPASSSGLVTAAKCPASEGARAPRRFLVMSLWQRPLETAYRKTWLQLPSVRWAVSFAPRSSIFRITFRSSLGVISAIGREPMAGKMSFTNRA
jgi:hypothetical protein